MIGPDSIFFFFSSRRRHTRWNCDWSSDVCSSDLAPADWIERARIVALSWDGLGVAAIAAKIGGHENKVRRWLHRFNAEGLDGLGNRPGCGRKRRITEAE